LPETGSKIITLILFYRANTEMALLIMGVGAARRQKFLKRLRKSEVAVYGSFRQPHYSGAAEAAGRIGAGAEGDCPQRGQCEHAGI
jgi:hypothetical protein